MSVYDWGGRLYDGLIYLSTFGKVEPIKDRLIAKLNLRPGFRVLDWGCGTGMSLQPIQRHLQKGRIYAIDRSPAMIKHAIARAKFGDELDVHFVVANGLSLDLPEKVDAAVASYSLGVLEPADFEKGVVAIWRNMREGGTVAVVDTEMPQTETQLGQIYMKIQRVILLRLFDDKCSSELMPTIERFFERIEVEFTPSMYNIAFLGKRRDRALPRAAP